MAKGKSRLGARSQLVACLLIGLLGARSAYAQPEDPGAAREWSHLVSVVEQQLAAVNAADRNLSTFSTQSKLTAKGKAQAKAVAAKLEASRAQLQSTLDAANLMAKRSKSTLDDAVKFRKANEAAMAEATENVSKEKALEGDTAMIDRSAEEAAARKAQAEQEAAARKAQAEQEAAARKAQAEQDAAARKAQAEQAAAARAAQAEQAAAARAAQAEQTRLQQEASRRDAEERRKAEAERQKTEAERQRAEAEQRRSAEEARRRSAEEQRRAAEDARKAAAEAAAAAAAAKQQAAEAAARSEVDARVSALERAAKEQINQAQGYAQMLSAFLAKPNLTIAARTTAMNHQRSLERITSLEKRVAGLRAMPAGQARMAVGAVQQDVERQDRDVRTTGEAARMLIGARESYLSGTAPAGGPPPPPPVAKAAEPAAAKAEAPQAPPPSHFRTEDVVPMCDFSFEPTATAKGVSIAIDGAPARPLPVRARLASGRHTLAVKKGAAQLELRELLLCGHVQVIPIDAPK